MSTDKAPAPQVEIQLPELPEPEGWTFQHEDTGRMTTLENDGINNPENFAKNNVRFVLCDSLYSEKQMHAYAQAALNARAGGDGWIAVTDRTPDEDTPVWCCVAGGEPFIGGYCYVDDGEESGWAWNNCENSHYLQGDKWKASDFIWDDQYNVTHWQPLPTPPAALASQAVGVGS